MPLLKPMLASACEDFSRLKFPLMASPKLDGIRAVMQDGLLRSRSLKPIANENVQALFAGLPEGTDGELIVGDPANEPFRRTSSIVMSDDKPADGVYLHVFDQMGRDADWFVNRFAHVARIIEGVNNAVIVPHVVLTNLVELETYEKMYLSEGYEGLMLRDMHGPYKHGRASEKEAWLLKVKRFEDAEARIIDYYPEMENQNEEFTNELGRTARSSHQANKVAKDQLGGFYVVGVGGRYDGVEFKVASGAMTHELRKSLWQDRSHVGDLLTYKFFPTGGDTKPRHPIWKGFRSKEDIV